MPHRVHQSLHVTQLDFFVMPLAMQLKVEHFLIPVTKRNHLLHTQLIVE